MNTEIYFAVNEDGTEVCANGYLFKFADALERLIERCPSYKLYEDRPNIWCNTYSHGYYNVPKFDGVVLPKGTIEKLTGQKLTFNDKPISLKINND